MSGLYIVICRLSIVVCPISIVICRNSIIKCYVTDLVYSTIRQRARFVYEAIDYIVNYKQTKR